ncbi:unnamed protein product [Lampetra fluviatilis]
MGAEKKPYPERGAPVTQGGAAASQGQPEAVAVLLLLPSIPQLLRRRTAATSKIGPTGRLCRDRGRAAALKRKSGGGGDGGGTEERSVGFRLVATAEQPFSAARRDLRRAPPRPPECDLRRAVRGMFHETTLK